jgi:hypothetical protein
VIGRPLPIHSSVKYIRKEFRRFLDKKCTLSVVQKLVAISIVFFKTSVRNSSTGHVILTIVSVELQEKLFVNSSDRI